MNGRTAKLLRREGLRPRKTVEHIPVDDQTNYAFDPQFYRERRGHTVTAPLNHVGHEIVGYVVAKVEAKEEHNPAGLYETVEEAQEHLPKLKRKDYQIRQVIKKPLSGMPIAPNMSEVVPDGKGGRVRIPTGHMGSR